ncbi:hypothetical protein Ddye_032642 [Dipteronia dyeriana]|uniref:Uncharacterized protein n=1 Tax=Dipteronia dyeriana TaxID=168575 RepID=A0AAD9TCN3_9ROSI|nr:hypothetical protein Ddye_032642 [Dipteronia dyeriana]
MCHLQGNSARASALGKAQARLACQDKAPARAACQRRGTSALGVPLARQQRVRMWPWQGTSARDLPHQARKRVHGFPCHGVPPRTRQGSTVWPGSLTGLVMGRDESERHTAESQWIVAARPLCHLQYPVAYLSRLQRILPAARWELRFKAAHTALPPHELHQRHVPLGTVSSESTVRRPGKAPEGAVPSPSPGRHATTRSRRGSSSSSPPTADGFGTGTPVPSPQSQSFSRSYGSILPTSLAYIVPSTRGCSPWRPDAVMSTTGRGWHSVLRIFKGRRGRTGHHATCGALPAAGPYLRLSRFQGGQAVKQKR